METDISKEFQRKLEEEEKHKLEEEEKIRKLEEIKEKITEQRYIKFKFRLAAFFATTSYLIVIAYLIQFYEAKRVVSLTHLFIGSFLTIVFIFGISFARRSILQADEKESNQLDYAERIDREQVDKRFTYAWTIAQNNLDKYFERNLRQLKYIFWISISVMTIGFLFILFGILQSIYSQQENASFLAAIAGIITEFIGATFMLIYRSTHKQAISYMSVLERINTVGMSFQVIESIEETYKDYKNKTKGEVAKLIIGDKFVDVTGIVENK